MAGLEKGKQIAQKSGPQLKQAFNHFFNPAAEQMAKQAVQKQVAQQMKNYQRLAENANRQQQPNPAYQPYIEKVKREAKPHIPLQNRVYIDQTGLNGNKEKFGHGTGEFIQPKQQIQKKETFQPNHNNMDQINQYQQQTGVNMYDQMYEARVRNQQLREQEKLKSLQQKELNKAIYGQQNFEEQQKDFDQIFNKQKYEMEEQQQPKMTKQEMNQMFGDLYQKTKLNRLFNPLFPYNSNFPINYQNPKQVEQILDSILPPGHKQISKQDQQTFLKKIMEQKDLADIQKEQSSLAHQQKEFKSIQAKNDQTSLDQTQKAALPTKYTSEQKDLGIVREDEKNVKQFVEEPNQLTNQQHEKKEIQIDEKMNKDLVDYNQGDKSMTVLKNQPQNLAKVEKQNQSVVQDKQAKDLAQRTEEQTSVAQDNQTKSLAQQKEEFSQITSDNQTKNLAQKNKEFSSLVQDNQNKSLAQQTKESSSVFQDKQAKNLANKNKQFSSIVQDNQQKSLTTQQEESSSLAQDNQTKSLAQQQEESSSLVYDQQAKDLAKRKKQFSSLAKDDQQKSLAQQKEESSSVFQDQSNKDLADRKKESSSITLDNQEKGLTQQQDEFSQLAFDNQTKELFKQQNESKFVAQDNQTKTLTQQQDEFNSLVQNQQQTDLTKLQDEKTSLTQDKQNKKIAKVSDEFNSLVPQNETFGQLSKEDQKKALQNKQNEFSSLTIDSKPNSLAQQQEEQSSIIKDSQQKAVVQPNDKQNYLYQTKQTSQLDDVNNKKVSQLADVSKEASLIQQRNDEAQIDTQNQEFKKVYKFDKIKEPLSYTQGRKSLTKNDQSQDLKANKEGQLDQRKQYNSFLTGSQMNKGEEVVQLNKDQSQIDNLQNNKYQFQKIVEPARNYLNSVKENQQLNNVSKQVGQLFDEKIGSQIRKQYRKQGPIKFEKIKVPNFYRNYQKEVQKNNSIFAKFTQNKEPTEIEQQTQQKSDVLQKSEQLESLSQLPFEQTSENTDLVIREKGEVDVYKKQPSDLMVIPEQKKVPFIAQQQDETKSQHFVPLNLGKMIMGKNLFSKEDYQKMQIASQFPFVYYTQQKFDQMSNKQKEMFLKDQIQPNQDPSVQKQQFDKLPCFAQDLLKSNQEFIKKIYADGFGSQFKSKICKSFFNKKNTKKENNEKDIRAILAMKDTEVLAEEEKEIKILEETVEEASQKDIVKAAPSTFKFNKMYFNNPIPFNFIQQESEDDLKKRVIDNFANVNKDEFVHNQMMNLPFYNLILDLEESCIMNFELKKCSDMTHYLTIYYKGLNKIEKRNTLLIKEKIIGLFRENNLQEIMEELTNEKYEEIFDKFEKSFNRMNYLMYEYKSE